jgi:hypothetical protein
MITFARKRGAICQYPSTAIGHLESFGGAEPCNWIMSTHAKYTTQNIKPPPNFQLFFFFAVFQLAAAGKLMDHQYITDSDRSRNEGELSKPDCIHLTQHFQHQHKNRTQNRLKRQKRLVRLN